MRAAGARRQLARQNICADGPSTVSRRLPPVRREDERDDVSGCKALGLIFDRREE